MQLVEQGKLSLEEPISKVLPNLASPQVLEGFGANGEPNCAPHKPITLRIHTHRPLRLHMWNGDMVTYLEKTGTLRHTCQNAALKRR